MKEFGKADKLKHETIVLSTGERLVRVVTEIVDKLDGNRFHGTISYLGKKTEVLYTSYKQGEQYVWVLASEGKAMEATGNYFCFDL